MLPRVALQRAILLLICLTPWCVEAREIYVHNLGGDDRWSGSVAQLVIEHGPVRTIQRALAIASKGDRIVVENTGSPYREAISLSAAKHCGFSAQPFIIEGNGATLDGSQPVPPTAWEFYQETTFRFQPRRLGYQQLFIDGRPAKRVHLHPDATDIPELQPLEWCVFAGRIFFSCEKDKLPADYQLSYAALPVGITLYHVHDVAVTGFTVQGFQLDGINAHDGVRECVVSAIVARGNGRAGIGIAGSSQLQVSGCLVGDNGTAQIYTEGLSATNVTSSDVIANTAPDYMRVGGRLFVEGQPRE